MNLDRRTIKNQKSEIENGFTLIEIMLVVVILGILATAGAIALGGRSQQASIVTTRTTIGAMMTAIDLFEVDHGVLPGGLDDLVNSSGQPQWHGPYYKGQLADAWGNPISLSKSGNTFTLTSMGPDGAAGGGDDITN